ncbi:hypothetical protein [Paraclostridium bifermentans]|uniref:hypothetical protein n=1 Tax=Paraclostridium bifermentans TaxID=1490 RepID=UPI00374EA51A
MGDFELNVNKNKDKELPYDYLERTTTQEERVKLYTEVDREISNINSGGKLEDSNIINLLTLLNRKVELKELDVNTYDCKYNLKLLHIDLAHMIARNYKTTKSKVIKSKKLEL